MFRKGQQKTANMDKREHPLAHGGDEAVRDQGREAPGDW